MASTTGIELGPDSCVLAGVRATRSGADIVALHTVEPAAWPSHDAALTEMLRGVRKSKKFPTRARVVAWGLPEDATIDAITRAAIRPLVDAGFRVDRVITPPQALAILASTRVRPGVQSTGVVWLALNMHGAAIAIVRGGELLFARTFQWAYNPHLLDTKAQLLQRYSLIAHLAPEVHRGVAAVRASHGVHVDAAVTCGDLPELRSLTMPLIEELDLEVETLDSMEGLRPVGKAKLERLAEAAPALRLACAAALAGGQRPRESVPPAARIAAAVAVVAALGYGAYAYFTRATASTATAARAVQTTPGPPAKPAVKATPKKTLPAPAGSVPRPQPDVMPPPQATASTSGTVAPKLPAQTAAKPEPPKPTPTQLTPPPPRSSPPATPSVKSPTQTVAKPAVQTVAKQESPKPTSPTPSPRTAPVVPAVPSSEIAVSKPDGAPPPPVLRGPTQGTSTPADTRGVIFPPSPRSMGQPRQVPLRDPLPRLDSVLIDQERRLAIIDGMVTKVGDQVGPRVVAQIDRDGVVFREPSGALVRVSLRSRQ